MEIHRTLFLHPSFRQKEYKWFVLVIQEEVGRVDEQRGANPKEDYVSKLTGRDLNRKPVLNS